MREYVFEMRKYVVESLGIKDEVEAVNSVEAAGKFAAKHLAAKSAIIVVIDENKVEKRWMWNADTKAVTGGWMR